MMVHRQGRSQGRQGANVRGRGSGGTGLFEGGEANVALHGTHVPGPGAPGPRDTRDTPETCLPWDFWPRKLWGGSPVFSERSVGEDESNNYIGYN